jgi:hypothetical protein
VAAKEEKSASIPWLPVLTLIGIGSGVLFFFPQLISSRPGGGDIRLAEYTFDPQTVDARLWQDPLGVTFENWQRNVESRKAHSICLFQDRLIKRCFAAASKSPPKEELRLVKQANQQPALTQRVQILAVMIPGGPYVEDVERRLRNRRAVIEGLGVAGYDPEKDHEIGYFSIPWQAFNPNVADCVFKLQKDRVRDETFNSRSELAIEPIRSNVRETSDFIETSSVREDADGRQTDPQELLVPYEWFEASSFCQRDRPSHLLVLWLIDDAFHDAPLARLADLISWFRFKFDTTSEAETSLPDFAVLGPDNSGTLRSMVTEASMVMEAKDAEWYDETRRCLATTHIYSSQAEAAETRLLSDIPDLPCPRTCKHLIEQSVKSRQPNSAFCFERTIPLDNQIVKVLREELKLRDVKEDDDVAILSEEDTFYARALCSSFVAPDVDGEIGPALPTVHAYTYLRGIDGKLPSDEKDEKETKAADQDTDKNNQTRSSLRPADGTEGLSQADDVRRLAKMLQDLDSDLRKGNSRNDNSCNGNLRYAKTRGLRAIGLLGSDVYDKLELLKALRPMFPGAVFFTNYLDARLAHPDEWKETHNLVVVSARGLSLEGPKEEFQRVAPFRDGGQTALFEATLAATRRIHPDEAQISNSPLVFEIGQNGAKELHVIGEKDTNELFNVFQRYLLHISCFVAFGSLLLVWTWSVTRVASVSSNAKTEAGEIEEEEEDSIGK